MTAAERWAEQLAGWGVPDRVLAQAEMSPWQHDPRRFAVDDRLDKNVLAAEVARSVLPPSGGSVLDVGCGGGRAAMSLVPPAEFVIGIDEDPAMLVAFTEAAAGSGARSMTIQGRWPDVALEAPVADVVVCHHVAYNVADIEPFVGALTGRARLAVVLVLPVRHPQSAWNAAWKHFWDVDRPDGPTPDDLVEVLHDLGLDVERWEMARPPIPRAADDPALLVPAARRRLCLPASREPEFADWLASHEPDWPTTHTVLRWPGDATD